MDKNRLGAFIDAVIAIIMTILVLELPKPESYDINGLLALKTNFFAYGLSFFWIGAMWVNLHSSYHVVDKINQKTVWSAIVMLFFSSFFPYITKLMADGFWNKTVQGLYGIVVLCITASVMIYYSQLSGENNTDEMRELALHRKKWIYVDIAIKILGLILSLTMFPPGASLAVLITLVTLVIPNQLLKG